MSTPVFAALRVGEVIAEREQQFTRDTLVRYAGASGDFNPIHYRDDRAQAAGLPGVLAHGMLTMGVAVAPVSEWLGVAGEVRDYQARFARPVLVDLHEGVTVTITAIVGALDETARSARIDVQVMCDGRSVLGKSQVLVVFT